MEKHAMPSSLKLNRRVRIADNVVVSDAIGIIAGPKGIPMNRRTP